MRGGSRVCNCGGHLCNIQEPKMLKMLKKKAEWPLLSPESLRSPESQEAEATSKHDSRVAHRLMKGEDEQKFPKTKKKQQPKTSPKRPKIKSTDPIHRTRKPLRECLLDEQSPITGLDQTGRRKLELGFDRTWSGPKTWSGFTRDSKELHKERLGIIRKVPVRWTQM